MKLLLCLTCGDVIQMRPEPRSCVCGASSGQYLEDGATVEQTEGSVSLALHNHDMSAAIHAYLEQPATWHPLMVFRAYVNPRCEADVRYRAPDAPTPLGSPDAPLDPASSSISVLPTPEG